MSAMTSLMVLAQAAAEPVARRGIQGGWGYVWTCYGITWGALALYSLSLWLRQPKNSPAGLKE
ncbi:MAG: hypothetical protein ACJ8AT_24800 [Hyalangium sp.]|uniref:hypothetical protein n=1 Tax=Hyalangium sp. TaxID=2028555 RepID=UPI00389AAD83